MNELVVVNKAMLQRVIAYMTENDDTIRTRFALERIVELAPVIDAGLLTEQQREAVANAETAQHFV